MDSPWPLLLYITFELLGALVGGIIARMVIDAKSTTHQKIDAS